MIHVIPASCSTLSATFSGAVRNCFGETTGLVVYANNEGSARSNWVMISPPMSFHARFETEDLILRLIDCEIS